MFALSAMQAQQFQQMIQGLASPEQRQMNARVCSASHLARRVVYELDRFYTPSEKDQIINVFDEDGEIREYFIKFIDTSHLGVVPYLLTPAVKENPRLHLVFRGVQDAPAWCRSTETPAPGCASFYAERFTILTALKEACERIGRDRYDLVISGHSLGGADAQTCATELMQVLVARHKDQSCFQEYKILENIKSLTVNHANSGGVQLSVTNACKGAAAYLTERKLLEIRLMCILTAGDGVQQTGQSHILADVAPNIAKVELVKLQSEFEGIVSKKYMIPALLTLPVTYIGCVAYAAWVARNAYAAHKQRFFDNADYKNQSFKLYDNSTSEGRDKILAKLSKHPLDNNVMQQMIHLFHILQRRYIETQRPPREQPFVIIDVQDYPDMPPADKVESQMQRSSVDRCVIS